MLGSRYELSLLTKIFSKFYLLHYVFFELHLVEWACHLSRHQILCSDDWIKPYEERKSYCWHHKDKQTNCRLVSFGMEDFAKKYGSLQPSQFVDVMSLMGDESDNIPGIEGIGAVHAVKLITKFGSLENLLAQVDQVEEERFRKALIANADQAILSKNLVKLRSDLPSYMVPFATEDLRFKKPEDNGEKFTSLLTAISAYAEGFSADPIIRRAIYLWKKLEKT